MKKILSNINKIFLKLGFLVIFFSVSCIPTKNSIKVNGTLVDLIALDQTLSVVMNSNLSITLDSTNANNLALTYSIVQSPPNGTLSGSAPNLVYTPTASYLGSDSFTFKVNDSAVATVSITVTALPNNAPVASNQALLVNDNATLAITLAATDADIGDSQTYTVLTNPTNGTLSGTAPNLTYTPTAPYNGTDSFTYRSNDGTVNSNTSTVTITVTHINNAPAATAQSVSVAYNTATAVTLAGTDADNDSLTYTVVATPGNGVLSGTAPNLIYTPNNNYSGSDSFTFTINDGTVNSAAAAVSITVNLPASNIYFCPDSNLPTPDYLWNTAANWYYNSDCSTDPALRIPITGDTVYVQGATFTDQPAAISLAGFIGNAPTSGSTVDISILANGILTVSGVSGVWLGTSDVTAIVTFNSSSYNGGTISGDAKFYDSAGHFGRVFGNAEFYNSSYNGYNEQISGNATFYDTSFNYGVILGTGEFYGNSVNGNTFGGPLTSTITGDATFNDFSYNIAIVSGSAFFNGNSFNNGNVTGDAIFNNNSEAIGGALAGLVTFNNDARVLTIFDTTFSGLVTFNDSSRCETYVSNPTAIVNFPAGSTFNHTSVNNCYINGPTVFNDTSYNSRIAYGGVIFNDNSYNAGDVVSAIFNNNSYNSGTISDNLVPTIFNDSSINIGTVVNGDATFNGSSANEGTVSGNATFNDSSNNIITSIINGTITCNTTGTCIFATTVISAAVYYDDGISIGASGSCTGNGANAITINISSAATGFSISGTATCVGGIYSAYLTNIGNAVDSSPTNPYWLPNNAYWLDATVTVMGSVGGSQSATTSGSW